MGLLFFNPLIIVNDLRITKPVRLPILPPLKMVVGVGFEPTNSEEGGFTARSL